MENDDTLHFILEVVSQFLISHPTSQIHILQYHFTVLFSSVYKIIINLNQMTLFYFNYKHNSFSSSYVTKNSKMRTSENSLGD